jgi:predicted acylesterase/phospholipase RssA
MNTESKEAPEAKLGLALSGGGFRASFFHLGVLKRLAELGILGRVEVLSTVSGGSVIAGLYVLLLKRAIEGLEEDAKGELGPRAYEQIVEELGERFIRGVRKNLRTRLLMNPFSTTWIMLTPWSLGDRMARLYEKYLYGPVIRDLPLTALRFSPPGESFEGGLDAYNRRHKTKIPKFILNATCLNSGQNWRFTSVEIGDPHLGIFRADEIGLLTPDQMKEAGIQRPEWDLVPRLKSYLEERSPEQLLEELRSGLTPAPVTTEVLAAEYLLRAHRGGYLSEFRERIGPEDEGLFRIPLGWAKVGLKLEDLVDSEMGKLYRAKVQAWCLHRGRESYRASGSEDQFWRELGRMGGRRVTALRDRARGDPAFRGQLMDFLIDLYYARIAWMAGEKVGADVGRIRLSEAVAASASFPPVFAPFSFLGLYDDRRVPIVRLVDGGVYDNMGLTALFEEGCTHVIVSDAGKLMELEPRVQGSRASMLGRISSVITSALRDFQLKHLVHEWELSAALKRVRATSGSADRNTEEAAQDHNLQQMAFFHMSKALEAGHEEGMDPHEAARAVAAIRTDLDAFGDAEIGALAYHGYALCDGFVRKHLAGDTLLMKGDQLPDPNPTPHRMRDRDREKEILEVGAHRAFKALRLGVIEAWIWMGAALGILVAGAWLIPISVQDVGRGLAWLFRSVGVDITARVPLGLVFLVAAVVIGFRLLWPSLFKKVSRLRRVATALKWARSFSALLFLVVAGIPFWIALVASGVALFGHLCLTRPFLRATRVAREGQSPGARAHNGG